MAIREPKVGINIKRGLAYARREFLKRPVRIPVVPMPIPKYVSALLIRCWTIGWKGAAEGAVPGLMSFLLPMYTVFAFEAYIKYPRPRVPTPISPQFIGADIVDLLNELRPDFFEKFLV